MIGKQMEINILWCIIYYLKNAKERVQIDQFWVSRSFYTHSILFFGTMRAVRRETESDRTASAAGVTRRFEPRARTGRYPVQLNN